LDLHECILDVFRVSPNAKFDYARESLFGPWSMFYWNFSFGIKKYF
jgi:hypothetical protein